MRSFQVAVAARIERQQICNLWRHHPEGRRQVISSLCTAREFCLRSFGPADRRPSACSNLPPLPRQLLRSRIRLSASSWISGRMALRRRLSLPICQSYLRFYRELSSFSSYLRFLHRNRSMLPAEPHLCFQRNPLKITRSCPDPSLFHPVAGPARGWSLIDRRK